MTADIPGLLKNNGEQLGAQIAHALNILMPHLQIRLSQLSLAGGHQERIGFESDPTLEDAR
jgi:hypothetical protein